MRVAVDIGGTYTDLVVSDTISGRLHVQKVLTTPDNPSRGVLEAVRLSGVAPAEVNDFVHGTTVVINALVERKGAKVALITTEGFRDVLEIARSQRFQMYDLRYRQPAPFVQRDLRFTVAERASYKGEILKALDVDDLERIIELLRASTVDAVAICFLHSYANPTHEEMCAQSISKALPHLFISQSNQILRRWGEYERTNTTVLNAYVQPMTHRYLNDLERQLRSSAIECPLRLMKSNGGTSSFAISQTTPIQLIESGPVGGVIGAKALGRAAGLDNLISLDIGGTTAKTSLIEAGEMRVIDDYRLIVDPGRGDGYPVSVPIVDIVEVGTGGGSIAWIDTGGTLKVGPRSAGADPGPACYGRGGAEPTLTDAHLIAGRIDPDFYLGGEQKISLARAREAFRPIADQIGMDVEEVALGAIRIANAQMLRAIQLVSVNRGRDPRDFAMVAFGGAGPMHASVLARELRIAKVVIPPAPGAFSAWGMLMADLRFDFVKTELLRSNDMTIGDLKRIWGELEATLLTFLEREGLPTDGVVFSHCADMRYLNQEHTVRVPIAANTPLRQIEERFHASHEQLYTFRLDSPIEWVHFRVSADIPGSKPLLEMLQCSEESAGTGEALTGTRRVGFEDSGWAVCSIYRRTLLQPGQIIEGPAVIEEVTSTIVIPPKQVATVDRLGNIVVDVGV